MVDLDNIIMETNINTYDQHMMIDKQLLNRIVNYADVQKKDVILEVGAGSGNLTELLAKRAKAVYAFEIDQRFKPQLDKLEKKYKNLVVTYQNAIIADFPKFDKIVSNIPYNISEQLFTKLMDYNFILGVLTIGKTFADLLTSGKYKESRVSILAPAYYNVKINESVPPSAFQPAPRTYSAVVTLVPKLKSELVEDPTLFITRELWQQKSKKTKNALCEAIINCYIALHGERLTKNQTKPIIDKTQLSEEILAKTVRCLSGNEFIDLAKEYSRLKL